VTAPLLGATYRAPPAELEPPDFSLTLVGRTGRFKTELTTLAQQHFGPPFGRKALPAQWTATANDIEKVAFEATDAVVVVDDFAPSGTSLNDSKLHEMAARVFRGSATTAPAGAWRRTAACAPTIRPGASS
jgi:hypothetical protein